MVIVVQFVRHFSVRRFEWFMALVFIGVGWALASPEDSFGNSSSYDLLARWATEQTWAEILIATGALRAIVLFFNGVVMRRAAEIRALLGVWSFSIVLMMALGFDAAAMAPSTAAPIYLLMAAFELSNIWTAAIDAHDRRAGRKHAGHTR
ncbi:hypothetical protein [Aureimonas sp. AU12]|uniref:hypothetical protein n=1 Tax=Aureimonas sp. AU12 TaxID=1638161 RepID=UPI000783D0EA|nr:hypothetical protein [Aureimonas sp. AU12]